MTTSCNLLSHFARSPSNLRTCTFCATSLKHPSSDTPRSPASSWLPGSRNDLLLLRPKPLKSRKGRCQTGGRREPKPNQWLGRSNSRVPFGPARAIWWPVCAKWPTRDEFDRQGAPLVRVARVVPVVAEDVHMIEWHRRWGEAVLHLFNEVGLLLLLVVDVQHTLAHAHHVASNRDDALQKAAVPRVDLEQRRRGSEADHFAPRRSASAQAHLVHQEAVARLECRRHRGGADIPRV
mmetsp:Transcript_16184/g.49156  ORF Transcript_16184/g.49156 Transcript_16184/m.49156 type:complete len:236 (+) Transcript_16184:314-1021(+)